MALRLQPSAEFGMGHRPKVGKRTVDGKRRRRAGDLSRRKARRHHPRRRGRVKSATGVTFASSFLHATGGVILT